MPVQNPLKIDIDMDHAFIAGQMVQRPDYVSRSEWLAFWEKIKPPPRPQFNL